MARLSAKEFHDATPEVFVSDSSVTLAVHRAVKSGKLRKLASRLYTWNFDDPPEDLVRRHIWDIVAGLFPDALVADRTALENAPAGDGSVCLISKSTRNIKLPGHVLRPRLGVAALPTDRPFMGDLNLSSPARAYLENMRPSRRRGGLVRRTLSREEIEGRLEAFIRLSGEDAVRELGQQILKLGPKLDMTDEASELNDLINSLLGAGDAELKAPVAIARRAGKPFDPDRIELFRILHSALREHHPVSRPARKRDIEGRITLSFFEAYFSNFIEGTEFDPDEAQRIVFNNEVPDERIQDAYDVIGTCSLVSDDKEMRKIPNDCEDLVRLLRKRHATILAKRPEKRPGEFKRTMNRVGSTFFVAPELVAGTLEKGFELYRNLDKPFQRATFMMFLVTEVHPFADGNGRTARVMMNAELVGGGEERIVIPTVYRSNYLTALRALSQNRSPEALIRTLDYAQRWTVAVDWSSIEKAEQALEKSNAFLEPSIADEEGWRLRIPE